MTRVDENREAQRAAEQQAAEKADKAKRAQNDDFKRQMAKQQQVAQDTNKKTQSQQGDKRAAGQALMARQGIQARNFNQSLQQTGEKAVDKARVDGKAKRNDVNETADEAKERNSKIDKQEQRQQDRLAPISRDDRQEQGQGMGGGGHGGGADAGGGDGGQHQPQQQIGMVASKQAEGARGAPQIPPEVIKELVQQAFAGVTPEGLHQFTVELKGDVFGGTRLDVVCNEGKISCTFHTNDKNVARLLKASEGPMARALSHKGLTLERLAVE